MVAAEHLDKKSFAKKLDELYDKLLSIGFSPPQIERALRATSLNGDAEGRKWEYPRTEMMGGGRASRSHSIHHHSSGRAHTMH